VDLLERQVDAAGVNAGVDGAELLLRPFQLVTLRLVRGQEQAGGKGP
jgi:alpha-mannosidase